MSQQSVEDVIEICDAGLDAEVIMAAVRAGLRQRRSEAEARGLDFDGLANGLPAAGAGTLLDAGLYHDLRRAGVAYDKVGVDLTLTPSHLPLIGALVQRVRAALHTLVVYYVNRLAGQQARVNEMLVRVLMGLTKALEASRAENARLHQEVEALEARLARLEAGHDVDAE